MALTTPTLRGRRRPSHASYAYLYLLLYQYTSEVLGFNININTSDKKDFKASPSRFERAMRTYKTYEHASIQYYKPA